MRRSLVPTILSPRLPSKRHRTCLLTAWIGSLCFLTGCQDDPYVPQVQEFDDSFSITGFFANPPFDYYEGINTIDSPRAEEGREFKVKVSRSDPSRSATFRLEVIGETATAGEDFQPNLFEETIPPGRLHTYLECSLPDDSVWEGDQTFRLSLTSLTEGYGELVDALAVVLVDNEPPPAWSNIHFPLELGRWWEYRGYRYSYSTASDESFREVERRLTVIGTVKMHGVDYFEVLFEAEGRSPRSEYWRQEGAQVLRTIPEADGDDWYSQRVRTSLPWPLVDTGSDTIDYEQTAFAVDTTIVTPTTYNEYHDEETIQSLGRSSMITPLGAFYGVHGAKTRSQRLRRYEGGNGSFEENVRHVFVGDSVGIVRWAETRNFDSSQGPLSFSSATFDLVDYGPR